MELGLLLHSIFAYPLHGVWRSFCGTHFCFLPHGKQQISNHIQNKVEVMEAKNNPYSETVARYFSPFWVFLLFISLIISIFT